MFIKVPVQVKRIFCSSVFIFFFFPGYSRVQSRSIGLLEPNYQILRPMIFAPRMKFRPIFQEPSLCAIVQQSTGLIRDSTAVPAYAILLTVGESMIDPIQVPILLKAIDFVFDEGRKILEERRERRKMNDIPSKSEVQEPQKEIAPLEIEKATEVKEDLLASKIDDLLWRNHEEEVQHLVRLLETYSRNYHLAKEQYAKWGDALVPPIIVHNMTNAESSMIETIGRLETVLSKVYKKDIN